MAVWLVAFPSIPKFDAVCRLSLRIEAAHNVEGRSGIAVSRGRTEVYSRSSDHHSKPENSGHTIASTVSFSWIFLRLAFGTEMNSSPAKAEPSF